MIRGRATTEGLPDDVLLEIFESYISGSEDPHKAWHPLVHVCQRWRYLVFSYPRRLGLCLVCTDSSPVKEMLDIWPPFLITIVSMPPNLVDNIIAALEYSDRIREIIIWHRNAPSSQLDRLVIMMQKPFPELESLCLGMDDWTVTLPTFPDTFLGGSAPRLRSLQLAHIPFPTLPQLLLSCNNLVDLALSGIPKSGYISPEAMVTSIAALTRLSSLLITFDSPASLPDRTTQRQRPPRLTRAVLPALATFWFNGVSEYLEDLVARINAPILNTVVVDQFGFRIQQFGQFIGHAPMFMAYTKAKLDLTSTFIAIHCSESSIEPFGLNSRCLKLRISSIGGEGDFQVSSMAQICSHLLFLMSRIERLHIQEPSQPLTTFQLNMDTTQWLELFRSFTAVQALYLCRSFLSPIVLALQGLGEDSVTDILPALVDLYLEGYQATAPELRDIEPFIGARQRSGRPVNVHCWNRLAH